ncbi:phosphotransferase family protein [Nocardioides sp. SYSU D00038]|uniref:phosphotransferase family protein n=1 Tax=Nocardioides sp. SYSU D00038 TaxID=2812554 RepID=UPI00196718CC|nr:phosphotransferase family protein [Nocardioides sp. SYSU D00038]
MLDARPDLDLVALADHLSSVDVPVDGPLSASLIEGGRSNLTFVLTDGERRWVLRRPPIAGRTPSAHDVAREFHVMAALQGSGVPVPRTVVVCTDPGVIGAEFTVVEFVDGVTVRTRADLAAVDDEGVAAHARGLVEALAALHAVDHRAVGLGGFGRDHDYAQRQLRRWSSQWALVSAEPSGLADRLVSGLADRLPAQRRATLVHGDFRIDNTILDPVVPGVVNAVVDWELSTIGEPVADVAMMCAYRHPGLDLVLGTQAAWTSDRLPDVASLAGLYEAESGHSLEHWNFYLSLAYYKLAVIAAGIHHRHQAGATVGPGFDTAGEAVAAFLEVGLDHLD